MLALKSMDEGVVTNAEIPLQLVSKHHILHGWPRSRMFLAPPLPPCYDRKLELSVAHEPVYWGTRMVLSAIAQKRMLQLLRVMKVRH